MAGPHSTTAPDSFVTARATSRLTDGDVARYRARSAEPATPAEHLIASRYRLVRVLGRGGHGEVWEADDLLSGDVVAIKLQSARVGDRAAAIRREVAALRLLRLPGVARLLDEGVERGVSFLVMERALGTPFPGAATGWDQVREPTFRLLEVLARVHAAGVVHGDLKPENVLVGARGEVTVLDFGISRLFTPLADPNAPSEPMAGTPYYLAPEQIRGDPLDARADLYAVGVMLFHALAGRYPHDDPTPLGLVMARLLRPAPTLVGLAPGVPVEVAATVDSLLAHDTSGRPRSAAEVLDALRGEPPPPPALVALASLAARTGGAALTERELRTLFVGPDRLHHLREDAARVLFARSKGEPKAVARELELWTRAGLARWDGPLVALDRDAIERLEEGAVGTEGTDRGEAGGVPTAPEPSLASLAALVVGADGSAEHAASVAGEAERVARRLAHSGRSAKAVHALAEGLHALEGHAGEGHRAAMRLFAVWIEIALADATPLGLDAVLYELCRWPEGDPSAAHLESLARAGLAELLVSPDRALAEVDSVRPFAALELERCRQHLRARVARRCSLERHEAVLDELAMWALGRPDPRSKATFAGALAALRYRQNRFDECAALHFEAASEDRWVTERVKHLVNGAAALMEAFRHEEAVEWGEHARALAIRWRLAFDEARAEWLIRCAGYRAERVGAPDLAFVEAVAAFAAIDTEALVCLTEGTIAWRAGALAEARDLGTRAQVIWKSLQKPWPALLARAVAIAAGSEPCEAELDRMVDEACACPIAGMGLQVLGLVADRLAGRATIPPEEAIRRLAEEVPVEKWGRRVDALTVNEALARLTSASVASVK